MWPILKQANLENYYFFLPLFFAIFLLSFPLVFASDIYSNLYFSIVTIYLFFIFYETFRLCKRVNDFLKIFFVLIFANLSPGFGTLLGFFNFFGKRKY